MLIATSTLVASLLVPGHGPAPTAPAPTALAPTALAPTKAAPAPVHCQVPCGIYGDHLRVELIREDCATIEKAMAQIAELSAAEDTNWNQLVRWVQTKEEHAQKIQDQLQEYWLVQRIKEPKAGDDEAMGTYVRQLMLQHRMLVSAMKCKQTTDAAHVVALRKSLDQFAETYFSPEDLEHLKQHEDHTEKKR